MSLDSPSKQDRIERHLMRQRGTGVRTITASFGFSFGTTLPINTSPKVLPADTNLRQSQEIQHGRHRSTPTKPKSSDKPSDVATATQKPEDTTSKRKLDNFIDEPATASNDDNPKDVEFFVQPQDNIKPVKRRKLQGEPAATKTPKTEKTSSSTLGRPRRRAAVSAAARVKEDLLEETIPVDLKRQDTKPSTSRSRKKRSATVAIGPTNEPCAIVELENANATACVSENNLSVLPIGKLFTLGDCQELGENDEVAAKPTKPPGRSKLPARAQKRRRVMRDEKEAENTSFRQPLAETDVNNSLCTPSLEKPSGKRQPKRNKSKNLPALNANSYAQDLAIARSPTKRSRKKLAVIREQDVVTESHSQNLDPTSANIEDELRSNAAPLPIEGSSYGSEQEGRCVTPIELGKIEATNVHPILTVLSEPSVKLKDSPFIFKANKALVIGLDNIDGNDLDDRQQIREPPKKRSRTLKGKVLKETAAGEEPTSSTSLEKSNKDSGTILDSPEAREDTLCKRQLRRTKGKKEAVPAIRGKTRRFLDKMPKMDLDELLSNIASLAQKINS